MVVKVKFQRLYHRRTPTSTTIRFASLSSDAEWVPGVPTMRLYLKKISVQIQGQDQE